MRRAVLGTLLALGLAACGTSSSSASHAQAASRSTTTPAHSAATSATTGAARTATGSAAPTSTASSGDLRATLVGQNHIPRAGKLWRYTVRVSGPGGHPVAGTADVGFTLGSMVVGHDSPRFHALKDGRVTELLTFPAAAAGQPLALQVIVRTKQGMLTLRWPVQVRP
jgi:hypothetical protein